jgi:hypothetical protein
VEKYVQDYFADFARNSSADFKKAQVRQMTVNKRLGATLDNVAGPRDDDDKRVPAERFYSNVYLTYSNYVHAKYPEVIDLYGGYSRSLLPSRNERYSQRRRELPNH